MKKYDLALDFCKIIAIVGIILIYLAFVYFCVKPTEEPQTPNKSAVEEIQPENRDMSLIHQRYTKAYITRGSGYFSVNVYKFDVISNRVLIETTDGNWYYTDLENVVLIDYER